jgi:predicted PurR-regulated permease PerM
MIAQRSLSNRVAFFLLFAAIGLLTFWLVQSYLDIIAFSLMSVIVLKPLYDRVLPRVGSRAGLATGLTIAAFFLAVVVPLFAALSVVVAQASSLIASMDLPSGSTPLADQVAEMLAWVDSLNLPFADQLLPQIQSWAIQAASSMATLVAQFAVGLGASVPDLISRLFIFLGIVGALLPHYHSFADRLRRLSPLDDEIDNIFLRRIKVTVHSMFLGIFVIAVAQGLVTGGLFWMAGVPYSPLLTLVAVVASMFPLGASLVALPVGIFLLATGRYIAGLAVLGGYFLIVSNVDTFLRPRLVSKEAYLSFALVLLSALGGYELFGFFGVVYGPVLMILFLTVLEVYERFYLPDPTVPVDVAASLSETIEAEVELDQVPDMGATRSL